MSNLIVTYPKTSELSDELRAQYTQDEIQIRSWLAQKRSKETRRIYLREVRAFFRLFPGLRLEEISTAHLAAFITQKNHLSYSSQAQSKNAMSSLLKYCVKSQYLNKDVSLALDPVKVPEQIGFRFLSKEEVERLLDSAKGLKRRDELLVRFYFLTGARAKEAVSLKWTHMKPGENKVQVSLIGKGFKARAVSISFELYEALLELKSERSEYVFHSNKEPYSALSTRQALRVVKKAASLAKLSKKVSTHFLRHAHASISLLSGAPLPTVQHSLGHASISSTGRYLFLLSLTKASGEYLSEFDLKKSKTKKKPKPKKSRATRKAKV